MAIYTKDKDSGQLKRIAGDGPTIVNPLLNYSTVEQDTGRKWIDGRTIYTCTKLITGITLTPDVWFYHPTARNLFPQFDVVVSKPICLGVNNKAIYSWDLVFATPTEFGIRSHFVYNDTGGVWVNLSYVK